MNWVVWFWSEIREDDRRGRSRLGPAGKVRGRSVAASRLGKSRAGERKHTKPICSICCEEGGLISEIHQVHVCLPKLLLESPGVFFVWFFSLKAHAIFYPPCGKPLLGFFSPGILGFCSGMHVCGGVRSDRSTFSVYLPFPVPRGHSVNKRLGFLSLSSASIHFLLAERDCCNPFLRGNTHSRVFLLNLSLK